MTAPTATKTRHPLRALAAVGLAAAATTGAIAYSCGGTGQPINTDSFPDPRRGSRVELVIAATYDRVDGDGEFRTNCQDSHQNFSDPIVYPGQPLKAHNHTYLGATDMDWSTKSPLDSKASTCEGGLINRTGYWVPSMINGAGDYIRLAQVRDSLQVYYKCGYRGVVCATIRAFPEGLKMIAGDSKSPQLRDLTKVWWTCQPNLTIQQGIQHLPRIPADCPAGQYVQAAIEFPQCWNGRDLDSPDHQSHMAYALGWPDLGCPPSHPVALPQITEFFRWRSDGNTAAWKIASDFGGSAPGGTLHADWWNGWNAQAMEKIVRNCLNPGLDCRMNLLGDGSMLTWDSSTAGDRPTSKDKGAEPQGQDVIPPVTTTTVPN